MKSKSNLNNLSNLSNNKFIKIMLITLVLGLSIYLLYFNDKIFIQDPLEASIVETFNVEKYVDICKNRKTNFYNFYNPNTTLFNKHDSSNCELECDTTLGCHAFIMKDTTKDNCLIYKGNLDSSGIDRNHVSVDVNCESKILPQDKGTYNGYGFINKKYFEDNKSKFKYKDAYLEDAGSILYDLKKIKEEREKLKSFTINAQTLPRYYTLRNTLDSYYTGLLTKINYINNFYFDNSKNILFTDFLKITAPNSDNVLIPKTKTMDDLYDIYNKDKTTTDSYNLDSKIDSVEKKYTTKHIQYLLLAFIMVITIILLILYKFSIDIINEKVLILYTIFITFTLLFLHHYIKI